MTSLQRTDRLTRIGVVTAGLSAAGSVVGALCAASSVTVIAIVADGIRAFTRATMGVVGISAAAGALMGMVGAPLLGWGLLRRVPLGRLIVVTSLGTIAGAVAGEWLRPFNPYARTLPSVIAGAFAGFLLAGIGLRLLAQRQTSAILDEPA